MCLNGSFKMTAFRNRLLGLAAGTLALSCFSSMAYAQGPEEVLDFTGSVFHSNGVGPQSDFTFNQSMILNNIGWVYDSSMDSNTSFKYQIGSLELAGNFVQESLQSFNVGDLDTVTGSGLRYLKSFTPLTIASGKIVRVSALYENGMVGSYYTRTGFKPNNSVVGVTHTPSLLGNAAGNLRVKPLGGSVAPEPGSFALALTGGAALLGICVRRRRNAG
jgi:hypothetical protein